MWMKRLVGAWTVWTMAVCAAPDCPRPPETPEETLALARRTYEYVAKALGEEALALERKELDCDATWLAGEKTAAGKRVVEKEIRRLRRRILFKHPDLQFDRLLAVQRGVRYVSELCMVDQYVGRWSRPGPGLVAIDNWKKAPRKTVLLGDKLPKGAVLDPTLHWDADRVVFAFADHTRVPEADPDAVKVPIVENMLGRHPNPEWVPAQDPTNPIFKEIDGVSQERKQAHLRYFIYEAATDGSWVRQLTGGPNDRLETTDGRQTVLVEDADPCYLPDGGIAFNSTRNQNFGRCHWGRYAPSFLLYRADGDGSNIRPLSFGEANEWRPSVLHDGRLVYTRWDYINRQAVPFQSLWATYPDGTAVSHVYGNYSRYMFTTTDAQAIPGSDRLLALASGHHYYSAGSIVLIDPRAGEDGAGPVTRVTPEIPFPEACAEKVFGGDAAWKPVPGAFQDPVAVNDTLFFASYSDEPLWYPKDHPRMKGKSWGGAWPSQAAYGVWLVDTLGGRELIYKEDEWSTFNPLPLVRRAKPPALVSHLPPAETAPTAGVCYVENVYDSRADIPKGSVAALRINRLVDYYACRRPTLNQNNDLALYKECLGEVPVAKDGSCVFRMPAGVPIQLQAVDTNGMAVLTMRSFIYAQRGEVQGCVGCHEQKTMSGPSVQVPRGHRVQEPVRRVDLGYAGPFSYLKSIRPLLERHCVKCHDGSSGKPCSLAGTNGWSNLVKRGHIRFVPSYKETDESKPYDYFAAASPLTKRLLAGHGGVKLTRAELDTFILWMDLNVPDRWLGGGYSWHTPEARLMGVAKKPLPPDGHDVAGTCGLDDDCECNSCWVRRGGYNLPSGGAARPSGSAGSPSPARRTQVLFFFDTEDFVSNRSHDAIRDLGTILAQEGVRGQFALSGYVAKKLVERGRTDVLQVLRGHLVGSQTLTHSVHPNLTELTDRADYDEAYRLALAEESEAFGLIKAATGHDRLWCSVFPGNGQSYVGLYLHAEAGIPFFGGCSGVYRGDRLGRGNVWYCNQRHLPYHGAFAIESFLLHRVASEKEIAAALDRAAKLETVVFAMHPCMAVCTEFWDELNFKGGNLRPWGDWIEPSHRDPAVTAAFYARYRALVRRLKGDPRFEITDCEKLHAQHRPRREITRAEVPALRAALMKRLGPIETPASWSVADCFQAAVRLLRGEKTYRPGKVYGFLTAPRGVTRPVKVRRGELVRAAEKMDLSRFLPAEIAVGDVTVGPADFLFAALEALENDACAEITVTPREQLGDIAYELPGLATFRHKGGWIYTPGFEDRWLADRLRLQFWTLRYE